jgi:multisubunit Na+/H+ antiporter MnhC subunit
MNKIDPPTKFQFSIARMLLATAAVALIFGIFKFLFTFDDMRVVIPTTLFSICIVVILLTIQKNEWKKTVGELFLSLGIEFVSIIFCVMICGLILWIIVKFK